MHTETDYSQLLTENKGLIYLLTKRLRLNKTVIAQKLGLEDIRNIIKYSIIEAKELQDKDMVLHDKPRYALGTYAYIRCLYNVKFLHSITTKLPSSVTTYNPEYGYDRKYIDRSISNIDNIDLLESLEPEELEFLKARYEYGLIIEDICEKYNLTYNEYHRKLDYLKNKIYEMSI